MKAPYCTVRGLLRLRLGNVNDTTHRVFKATVIIYHVQDCTVVVLYITRFLYSRLHISFIVDCTVLVLYSTVE